MCMGYGYCCCCGTCRYKNPPNWSLSWTEEVLTLFMTKDAGAFTVKTDDGSPFRCNGVQSGSRKQPCLEISLDVTLTDFAAIPPLSQDYYSASLFIAWIDGWTWTPDGLRHSFGGRCDTELRRTFTKHIGLPAQQDWDFDRDGPTNAVGGGVIAPVFVKQDGIVYINNIGANVSDTLAESGLGYTGSPLWRRSVQNGPPFRGFTVNDYPWTTSDLEAPIGGTWLQVRDWAGDPDTAALVAPTFSSAPSNTLGAPEWQLGIGIGKSFLNSFTPSGTPTWEPSTVTYRIDNYCLMIDPPTD